MMYQLFNNYLNTTQLIMTGILFTFFITFLALKFPLPFLPVDQGREFAINGKLSKGKIRGVGLTFVLCFIISSILFLPIDREYIIYLILLFCVMLSGYLDDAADTPWSDYKKGFIDLIISIVTMLTFVNYNTTVIHFFETELVIPKAVYVILGIILIWVSINVTNCSDGVDGLCASLCTVSLISFSLMYLVCIQMQTSYLSQFYLPICISTPLRAVCLWEMPDRVRLGFILQSSQSNQDIHSFTSCWQQC